ncbi:MAG TPA: FliM/FliN family flagellar motor switch protein [Solirubrobacteraceae bacterium]|nr:FliM/FliN family flagellar motor switch protein [Solirubrobacteraceae bacterium]
MNVSSPNSPEAQAGNAPAQPGNAPAQAGNAQAQVQVRALDFSQPTKFTIELRRRIGRAFDPFCETTAARLSAELRVPVELELTDSSQLTWAAAKAPLAADAIAVALHAQPIDKQMLLSVELPLVLRALECLLGGTPAQAPAERRLSEIDWALTRTLLDSITTQLSLAWRDLGGLELAVGEVDPEGDAGVFAPLGEPTFSLTLECKIDGLSSTLALLIPWSSIEPVAEEILGTSGAHARGNPREAQAVRRGVASARVLLRAEVGATQMPVERMLALTPGALLTLQARAEHGVELFAEGVSIGRASPGRRGPRRALKLESAMTAAAAAQSRAHTAFPRSEPEAARANPGANANANPDAGADTRANPGADAPPADAPPADATAAAAQTLAGIAALRNVNVRVWAELGRTKLPLGQALELPPGTVLELEQGADDPIELFVNGLLFAHGSLVVTDDGEWAVQVHTLV